PGAKWTVRAGGGIFYGGPAGLGASARMLRNFPFVSVVTARGTAKAPKILLEDGIPPDFLGDLNAPIESVDDLPADSVIRTWSRGNRLPMVYQRNFSVQRQWRQTLALTTAYVVSSSTNQPFDYDINAPGPGPVSTEAERRIFFPALNTLTYRSPA